jgi:hypothetical protein
MDVLSQSAASYPIVPGLAAARNADYDRLLDNL